MQKIMGKKKYNLKNDCNGMLITIKHLQVNQILALNNPNPVDCSCKKE